MVFIVGLDSGISNYGKLIEHGNTEMDCLLCLQTYVIVRIEIALPPPKLDFQ